MVNKFDWVLGPLQLFGDTQWQVGVFQEGNCLSWHSFSSKQEAEEWLKTSDAKNRTVEDPQFVLN